MALRRDPVQWIRSALAGRGSDTDLPVADLLALRAGLHAGGGVGEVVRGLGTSTAPALRQMAVAVDSGTSLAAQADAPSAGPLVRALAVAEVSGSSATPALGAILDAVTAEQRLRRLVDARSAQALMTARMLVILPVLAAAAISLGDPGSRGFLASGPGIVLTTTAGAMIALAAWWMRRLVAGVGRAVAATDPLHPGRSRPRILLARRAAACRWTPGGAAFT